MKRAWILAVLTVASVTGLGYVHPFGNPRVEPARGLGTLLQGANLSRVAASVNCMWFSFRENDMAVAPGESGEVGDPGTLGMTKGRVYLVDTAGLSVTERQTP